MKVYDKMYISDIIPRKMGRLNLPDGLHVLFIILYPIAYFDAFELEELI